MAVLCRAALVFAVLLSAFLETSIGQGIPECTCGSTPIDECFGAPCIEVHCSSIDSAAKVQCAGEFLNNITAAAAGVPLKVTISTSSLEIFPDDFFVPFDVIAIEFNECPMTELPHRLFDPVCGALLDLEIYECNTIATLQEAEFSICPNLEKLFLTGNGIQEVSSAAFSGLSNLKSLSLNENELTGFTGFEGIQSLELLDLSFNQLSSIAKDAFQGLGQLLVIELHDNSLTTLEQGTFDPLLNSPIDVALEGNPLNCDCSLKWLQDWVLANDSDQQATCATPVEGPLVDADFSTCSQKLF